MYGMLASQYEMTLPADYDLPTLRRRIAAAWHTLDHLDGLGLKAYLFRERGRDGSPVNEYSCFYLWNDPGAMAGFLVGGGGFERIIRFFGRPAVRQWSGLACLSGPARGTTPRAASRQLTVLPPEADPESTGLTLATRIQQEIDALAELARREDVHTAALAVDTHHWQLVRFVLWQDSVPPDQQGTERYEVLHLSAPGLADLPNGRHW